MAGLELERTFRIDVYAGVIAVDLSYTDEELRAQIKARGYRWDSGKREWRKPMGSPKEVRAEAIALLALGLALRAGMDGAGNQPLALAEIAVRYALPLPLPVALWGAVEAAELTLAPNSRMSYTIQSADLRGGLLTSVALGERGQRAHAREVENAVAYDAVAAVQA
jgi:hypothetical protein